MFAISERLELAKLCSSRDWSKAIRVLDLLVTQSSNILDICNRAFCYSKLELHKHVIKDCDKALQIDSALLQAYILKGCALLSLGRKNEAIVVWKKGYEHALHQPVELKQLLELEELLKFVKQDSGLLPENGAIVFKSLMNDNESKSIDDIKSSEALAEQNKLGEASDLCNESWDVSEVGSISDLLVEGGNGISKSIEESSSISAVENGVHLKDATSEEHTNQNNLCDDSELCTYSGDSSEIHRKSVDSPQMRNVFCDKTKILTSPDSSMNEVEVNKDVVSVNSEQCNEANRPPEQAGKSSLMCSNSSGSETRRRLSDRTNMPKGVDESKKSEKICATKVSKSKSISVDFRLSRGIAQVNEGRYTAAISIFDQILKEDPNNPEALIARGTAYALQRELQAAIADFSKAIQTNPSAGEAWKRRGQARAASGESLEAIEDLTKALEFDPNSADILHERGIVSFKFKDYYAAIEDLSGCVKMDKDNKSAYTNLGLALSSVGEYKRAEEAHLKSIQIDRHFLMAWAHLTQFYQDLANSTKALECIQQACQIDIRFVKAYHLRGLLLHGMGEHRKAIEDLSIGLSIENSNIECLYLRASCYHAIGLYTEAVKNYDATLDVELDSMEKFVLQCLAFYQKEIALYTASKIHSEFCWFDIDGDLNPLFKEYWCKRLHPKDVCEKVFRQPPLRDSFKKGKLRKQDFAMTKQKTILLAAADNIGKKIQYDCPGFLPNRRQHRMAGLAAIEISQKVSKAWRSMQLEWKHANKGLTKYGKRVCGRNNMRSQNRGGPGCSTSSSSETSTSCNSLEDRSSGRSMMSWQDVYSLAVKWRQISEPCDPVVWVNKLSEAFNSGFGSHTPMILGQAKVVRYYAYCERTLEVAKTIIKEKKFVHDKTDQIIDLSADEKLQSIQSAKTCSDLYKVVGEDFWVATWCNSTAFEGKQLEGTRITIVKMDERGFDFAIRTPCTPARWDDFDSEMATAWDAICNAYCGETYGSTDFHVLENVREAILRMTYYWYNFMPLSRGSAAVGFVVMLGLLTAANMEFTGKIPKGWQVDWEAILNFDPNSFVDSIRDWLYPSLKVTTSWKDYPDVASTLATTGSVVAALSTYDNRASPCPDKVENLASAELKSSRE